MSRLFLDDLRVPYDIFKLTINPIYEKNVDWVIVKTYNDFVAYIELNGIPEIVSFDHDLSNEHYEVVDGDIEYGNYDIKTGYEAAMWLVVHCKDKECDFPEYLIHSANPEGVKNIRNYIEGSVKVF